MSVTPAQRRTALESLALPRLRELTALLELHAFDGRSKEAHVSALLAKPDLDFPELLASLKREELKEMCEALGLTRDGKTIAELVERIVHIGAAPKEGKVIANPTTPAAPAARRKPTVDPASQGEIATAYEHKDKKRLNIPGVGEIDHDKPPPQPKKTYSYDPHLDPQLQWAGKAEHTSFEVDTVNLHIHERVSTPAILHAVRREDVQRSLFAEPELDAAKQIDFYAHEVGWSNRLILGDSLVVMNSLLEREHLAGKVQCIYIDPPYGVKFNSNFQPRIGQRDVKDGDDGSLTREPEQIQAYRDTWTLGVHSYLTYLRDRLLMARELLHETGSCFVQISDENVHHVRELMDEMFGAGNFVSCIVFAKTSGTTSNFLPTGNDFVVWYAKEKKVTKYRQIFLEKAGSEIAGYNRVRLLNGTMRSLTDEELSKPGLLPDGARIFSMADVTSQSSGRDRGVGAACWFPVEFEGRAFTPGERTWTTNEDGMRRLLAAGRLASAGASLRYVRYQDDFPVYPLSNNWDDTGTGSFTETKVYVVQTGLKVVARCLLMTTDPGDLVLDPTCGSGTTAYVAEQWGRRWITTDTSRVALALARQRLLTAKFPMYELRTNTPKDGFRYKTVPHITLKSIAQNPKLDACKTREEMERLIRATAEQETLYDQPEEDRSKVRVSGPFSVEAIPVATMAGADVSPLAPDARADDLARPSTAAAKNAASAQDERMGSEPRAASDWVGFLLDQLRKTGVHFRTAKGTSHLPLAAVRPLKTAYEYLHAEAATGIEGDTRRVAISFGPKNGPVTPFQVRDAITQTRGFDLVLFVGFACDPEALRMIETSVYGRELHFVHAAPDILVGDLLKTQKATKLFTVFGAPDVKLGKPDKEGNITVELTGVDLYDPITGETTASKGDDVAAWFLDQAYDDRTFCICQAFFPAGKMKNPWEKLQKALKGSIDEEKFEALRGTKSLPFKPGRRIAVKVVDDRGNEVMKVVEVAR